MESYNGLVFPNGARVSFRVRPHADIVVQPIVFRNHPAFNRRGASHCVTATAPIPSGTHLGLYAGAVVSGSEWNPYQLTSKDGVGYYIDGLRVGNELRYINDYRSVAAEPNVAFFLNRTRVADHYVSVVVATRDISPDEELLLDYGDGYWNAMEQWNERQNPHACTECAYRTTTAKNLRQHKDRNHRERTRYECYHCDKLFTLKQSLDRHLETVNGFTLYKCDDCSFETHCQKTLNCHVRDKHGPSPQFKCLTCGATFKRPGTLARHTSAVHEKKRPHACDECEFTSAYKQEIKRHKHRKH